MRLRPILAVTLVIAGLGASGQEAPKYYQLLLPDFFSKPFEGGSQIIDVPDRPFRHFSILVIDAFNRNITSSSIRVWINGKGAGNILEVRNVENGALLNVDPAALNKRPDELFDLHENTIEVSSTDKRGRVYYQSWVIRASVDRNAWFTYTSAVSPNDSEGVPPDIILQSPAQPPVLTPAQQSVTVKLTGLCSAARAGTSLTVNGKAILKTSSATAPFDESVDVKRGTPAIDIEAVDASGNRRTVLIPVITQEKVVPKVRSAGNKYALIVGISRYGTGPDAPPVLSHSVADAKELASSLEEKAGFKKENIRMLLDDQASPDQLRTAFYDFVAKAQANATLVVYISAYGLNDPHPGKSDKLFLTAYGTKLSQLDSTALNFSDLEMLLSKSVRCNNTFVIFDAEHPMPADWRYPGKNLINNHLLSLFSDQDGRAVIVSGLAGEDSLEGKSGSGGLFADTLSRGLAGEADLNADHVVTANELFRYVSERVRQDSAGQQHPVYRLPERNVQAALNQ
jgi:Caspase domain